MSSVSFSANCITKIRQAKIHSHTNSKHEKANALWCYYYNSQSSNRPIAFSQGHKDLLAVPLCAKKPEPGGGGEEDSRALETVLKLCSAIKNKNIRQLSGLIGDECQCVCNVFTSFHILQGKKQVVDFFTYVISNLGNHIDFVVTPTMQDGMKVRLKWKLEWKRTHVPLGKGFSIHVCHVYHGKVDIRHVEMFLEPLLHIEHLRLVALGFVTTLFDKMSTNPIFKDKPKSVLYLVLRIFIIVLVLFGKCTLIH